MASTGTSNFWMEASDSPSLPRRLAAALLSAFSTSSFVAASSCSLANVSPAAATDRIDANHVLTAQVGNRTQENRLAACPHAEFSRHVAGDAVTGLAAHQAHRFTHLAVGENVEKGRLAELHGQCLLQGIIENGVAGLVVEIGEDDRVFLGQSALLDANGSRDRQRRVRQPQPRQREPESSRVSCLCRNFGHLYGAR